MTYVNPPPTNPSPPPYVNPPPAPVEAPGSSASTAIAVGVGSVIGATLLVAAAPVVLPIIGLGAVAAVFTPVVGGVIGAATGWWMGGKT